MNRLGVNKSHTAICQQTTLPVTMLIAAFLCALLLLASPNGYSEELNCHGQTTTQVKKPAAKPPAAQVNYRPPRLGSPKTRVGGGTRGNNALPSIELLAPTSTGLTANVSPKLFWHLSHPHIGLFEFVIIEHLSSNPKPVFRHQAEAGFCAGFHALNLAEFEVELQTGITYQWSVAIVRDAARRSQDIVGHATIERIAAAESNAATSVARYADAGIWYDAIEASSPASYPGRNDRLTSLLKQVGLQDISN